VRYFAEGIRAVAQFHETRHMLIAKWREKLEREKKEEYFPFCEQRHIKHKFTFCGQ